MTATPPTSLAAFLESRLAEDEAAARAATPGPWTHRAGSGDVEDAAERSLMDYPDLSDLDAAHIASHDPARVLTECAALRSVVNLAAAWEEVQPRDERTIGAMNAMRATLRALASVYAGHEGWDASWGM